jgi:hypothetical protein
MSTILLVDSVWLWEGYAETVPRFQFCRMNNLGDFCVPRNGVQTNQGVQVNMHPSSFIHLNTVDTGERLENRRTCKMEMDMKQKQTWASEHHQNLTMLISAKEKRVANLDI